jgi:uncharacterized phage protein (TIGR01671 family)
MRTIKFRYWCTIEQKMYDKAYVEEHLNFAMMSELLEAAQQRYVFQQFTGLHDKNGREIYEGDVVYFEVFDGLVDVSDKAKVYFKDGCFRLNHIHPLCDYFNVGTVEVIGNNYENPELVK